MMVPFLKFEQRSFQIPFLVDAFVLISKMLQQNKCSDNAKIRSRLPYIRLIDGLSDGSIPLFKRESKLSLFSSMWETLPIVESPIRFKISKNWIKKLDQKSPSIQFPGGQVQRRSSITMPGSTVV